MVAKSRMCPQGRRDVCPQGLGRVGDPQGSVSANVVLPPQGGVVARFSDFQYPQGYCYLLYFDVLSGYGLNFNRVDVLKLGAYPKFRKVVAYMFSIMDQDYPVPGPCFSSYGVYHIDVRSAYVPFSELVSVACFSNCVIGADDGVGACVNLEMDECVARAERVDKLRLLVNMSGLDMSSAVAEAANCTIRREIREDNTNLKAVLNECGNRSRNGKKLILRFVLNPTELASLQTDYPELGVATSAKELHPHGVAAAQRCCAEQFILDLVRYDVGKVVRGYDKYIIDIGANYVRHVIRGRVANTHFCCPILDVRDSCRETERLAVMRDAVINRKISQKTFDRVSHPSDLRCFNKAGNGGCKVTAPYGMFLHSVYDMSIDDVLDAFDSHKFEIVWMVMHFDIQVFYKKNFVIPSLNAVCQVADGKIKFKFGNDSALGYEHSYNDYMKFLTRRVFVTKDGRCYLAECLYEKSNSLFIKFTYAANRPESLSLKNEFSYWGNASDKVMVCTWSYGDGYYLDSKISGSGVPIRFTRKYLEVSRSLYDLVLGHCIRSGDRSFSVNEIFSAAQSYNSRMTINGVDIRTRERLPSLELLDLVVAIFCIAFNARFNSGKVIEAFVSQEKEKRKRNRLRFVDVLGGVFKPEQDGKFQGLFTLWNSFVGYFSEKRATRDLNFNLSESVRMFSVSEFVEIFAAFNRDVCGRGTSIEERMSAMTDCDIVCTDKDGALLDWDEFISNRFSDNNVEKKTKKKNNKTSNVMLDVLRTTDSVISSAGESCVSERSNGDTVSTVVVNDECVVRERMVSDVSDVVCERVVSCVSDVVGNVSKVVFEEKKKNKEEKTKKPSSITSVKDYRGAVNVMYRSMSGISLDGDIPSTVDRHNISELRKKKNDPGKCSFRHIVNMKGDGQCLFYALRHHVSLIRDMNILRFRDLLYHLSTSAEKDEQKYLREYKEQGRSASVSVFSRVFNVPVCVHGFVVETKFHMLTRFMSNCGDGAEDAHIRDCVHLKWRIVGNGGHVDVITEDASLFLDLSERLVACIDRSKREISAEDSQLFLRRMLNGVFLLTNTDTWQTAGKVDASIVSALKCVDSGNRGVWLESVDMLPNGYDPRKYPDIRWHVFTAKAMHGIPDRVFRMFEYVRVMCDWRSAWGATNVVVVCGNPGKGVFNPGRITVEWLDDWVTLADLCEKGLSTAVDNLNFGCKAMFEGAGKSYDLSMSSVLGRNRTPDSFGDFASRGGFAPPSDGTESTIPDDSSDCKSVKRVTFSVVEKLGWAVKSVGDVGKFLDCFVRKYFGGYTVMHNSVRAELLHILGRHFRTDAQVISVIQARSSALPEWVEPGVMTVRKTGIRKDIERRIVGDAALSRVRPGSQVISVRGENLAVKAYGVVGSLTIGSDGIAVCGQKPKNVDTSINFRDVRVNSVCRGYVRDVACGADGCVQFVSRLATLGVLRVGVNVATNTEFVESDCVSDCVTDEDFDSVSMVCPRVDESTSVRDDVSDLIKFSPDESSHLSTSVRDELSECSNGVSGVLSLLSNGMQDKLSECASLLSKSVRDEFDECSRSVSDAPCNQPRSVQDALSDCSIGVLSWDGYDSLAPFGNNAGLPDGSVCELSSLNSVPCYGYEDLADTCTDVGSSVFDGCDFSSVGSGRYLTNGGSGFSECVDDRARMSGESSVVSVDTLPWDGTSGCELDGSFTPNLSFDSTYECESIYVVDEKNKKKKEKKEKVLNDCSDGSVVVVEPSKIIGQFDTIAGTDSVDRVNDCIVNVSRVNSFPAGSTAILNDVNDCVNGLKMPTTRVRVPLAPRKITSDQGFIKRLIRKNKPLKNMVDVHLDNFLDGVNTYRYFIADPNCVVHEYHNYPGNCALALAFFTYDDDDSDYVYVSRGFRKHRSFSSVRVKFDRVVQHWYRVNSLSVEAYCVEMNDVSYLLVNLKKPCVDLRNLLITLKEWFGDRGPRVAIDVYDIGTIAMKDIVDACYPLRVCLYNYRDEKFSCLENSVACEKKTQIKVFPKLSDEELGIIREPSYVPGNDSHVSFINSFIEYRHVVAVADDVNAVLLKEMWERVVDTRCNYDMKDYLAGYKANVYDNSSKSFIFPKAMGKYMFGYANGYVEWVDRENRFDTKERYIVVSEKTVIMLNQAIYRRLSKIDSMKLRVPDIEWVNGVPGCGKTEFIVVNHRAGVDLVLTSTTEGVEDIRRRVKKPEHKDSYRTIASVLVNGVGKKTYARIIIDEALMVHAGAVAALCAVVGCKSVMLLGDKNQIPYIDFDHVCTQRYSDISKYSAVSKNLRCTYRCPIDVCYVLRDCYPGIYTENNCARSMSVRPYSGSVIPKREGVLYLSHLKADKEMLVNNGYGRMKGSKVLTVHEAQGLVSDHVIMVRSQTKPLQVYDLSGHAIVAISRHRKTFVYFTDTDDAVSKFVRGSEVNEAGLREWNFISKASSVPMGMYIPADVGIERPSWSDVDLACTRYIPSDRHMPGRPVLLGKAVCNYVSAVVIPVKGDKDVEYLQEFYDDKVSGASTHVYDYDQQIVEYSDISVPVDSLRVAVGQGPYIHSKYDKLRPYLRTSMAANRRPSQRESILGLAKRNLNAPKLMNDMDPDTLGKLLFRNFVRSAIKDDAVSIFDSYIDDPVRVNDGMIGEWFETQKPGVNKMAVSEVPLHLRRYNRFDFMVKPQIKPSMEVGSVYKYASVQTIAYSAKDVNVVFCPIFNVMRDRMYAVMKDNLHVFTGMSAEDFVLRLNERVNIGALDGVDVIELDMSKYDKAQALALLRFECLLYEALGMDPELVEVWFNSHRKSVITDRKGGVQVDTEYQRKSGDASTFFGNTMCLAAVVLACYDVDFISLGVFAGDDSVLWYDGPRVDPSTIMADLFNLESKLLMSFSVPYFCSKFILIVDRVLYMVPDLLKLITKLGRRDMNNFDHVEEYRVSCCDAVRPLLNEHLMCALSAGVHERYGGEIVDCRKAVRIIKSLVSNRFKFRQLYVMEDGMNLCMDPSRSAV